MCDVEAAMAKVGHGVKTREQRWLAQSFPLGAGKMLRKSRCCLSGDRDLDQTFAIVLMEKNATAVDIDRCMAFAS